jgi:hypothetical protein
MGVDDVTSVDTLSLADFQRTLSGRLDEATEMLMRLAAPTRQSAPALGGFQDATQVAARYQALRDEYLAYVNRLLGAVSAAQMAVTLIGERYQTTEALHDARVRDIASALRPVGEVLHGGR